jgi:hypothetical protein
MDRLRSPATCARVTTGVLELWVDNKVLTPLRRTYKVAERFAGFEESAMVVPLDSGSKSSWTLDAVSATVERVCDEFAIENAWEDG